MEQFTIKEFMDRLQADSLKSCTIKGLAKKAGSATEILFKAGHSDGWIKVPVSLISKVTFLKNVHCGEDNYPLVQLHLAEPTSSDGKVMYELLSAFSDQDHCSCHGARGQGCHCGCGSIAHGAMPGAPQQHYYACGCGHHLHGPFTYAPHK